MSDESSIPDSTSGVGLPTGASTPKPGGTFGFPWRLVTALIVFGVIVLFAFQNTASIDVNFILWDFRVPLIVLITATMVLSVVFGDMVDWWWKRRKRQRKSEG